MTQDLGLSCKELVELVTAYDEGVLPVEERARFDEHLTECPDCVEYLAQFRRTVAAIGLAAPSLKARPRSPTCCASSAIGRGASTAAWPARAEHTPARRTIVSCSLPSIASRSRW